MTTPPDSPWVVQVREETALAALRPLGRSALPLPPSDSPIVVGVVKDERLRIEDFLRHYRQAGIRRFCFVDNASADGTAEFLAAQPDVDLFATDRPYGGPAKQGWIMAALAAYGADRWVINADADELIVFDGIEAHGFEGLARAMDARGIRRVRGLMLDMYAEGRLLGAAYAPGQRLQDAFPFLDAGGYLEREADWAFQILGGARQRAFGGADPGFVPNMAKVPMLRLGAEELLVHPHYAWPIGPNFAAPRLLGLLHFKFLPDFAARVDAAVRSGQYFRGSAEYRVYQAVCARKPELELHGAHSLRYGGPASLVKAGLVGAVGWATPARPPSPDGGVSRLVPALVPRGEMRLLTESFAGQRGACVVGLGPAALVALHGGIERLVVVESDEALVAAFLRRRPAAEAAREGRLTIIRGAGAAALDAAWAIWRQERIFPVLVAHGPFRLATTFAALRCAAAMGVPAAQVTILFASLGPARPWYAPVLDATEAVCRRGLYTLLRPRADLDPAALEAAWTAARDDAR